MNTTSHPVWPFGAKTGILLGKHNSSEILKKGASCSCFWPAEPPKGHCPVQTWFALGRQLPIHS